VKRRGVEKLPAFFVVLNRRWSGEALIYYLYYGGCVVIALRGEGGLDG